MKNKILEFSCNKIRLTDDGLGIDVMFESLDNDGDKYFLIQKHFEDEESFNEPAYVELYFEDIASHYHPSVEVGKKYCIFKFANYEVKINYKVSEKKLAKLKRFLNPLCKLTEV